MDKVLEDLKRIREETEDRFNAVVEELESVQRRLEGELRALCKSSLPPAGEEDYDTVGRITVFLQDYLTIHRQMINGLRESIALHNARCAEIARQLTVLPLERMDLILDNFERRLEAHENELHRIRAAVEKPAGRKSGKS